MYVLDFPPKNLLNGVISKIQMCKYTHFYLTVCITVNIFIDKLT